MTQDEQRSQHKEHFVESAKGILQNLIVVASLVHTLTDSFGSVSDLYRKLKRERKPEDSDDSKKERRHVSPSRRRRDSNADSDYRDRDRRRLERSKSRKGQRSKSRRRGWERDGSDSDEDSINESSGLVLAEYERGYHYLGEKYALGDVIAQNQLQAQIISLQQTLLTIYQTPQHHPIPQQLSQLLQTTRAARAASIEALAMQYQRMLPIPDTVPAKHIPESKPISQHSSLYCIYALDLQKYPDQPLADAYHRDGDSRCPFCSTTVLIRPGKAWEIVKEDEKRRGAHAQRVFLVQQRLIVKCHRQGGGFACVVCSRCREADTICGEPRALIDHLWREHTCAELEGDEDVQEVE